MSNYKHCPGCLKDVREDRMYCEFCGTSFKQTVINRKRELNYDYNDDNDTSTNFLKEKGIDDTLVPTMQLDVDEEFYEDKPYQEIEIIKPNKTTRNKEYDDSPSFFQENKKLLLIIFSVFIVIIIISAVLYNLYFQEYKVNYHDTHDTINNNPDSYTYFDDIIQLYNIEANGYTFDGWYSDPSFLHPINLIDCHDKKDIDIYAKWTPIEYTITYDVNGGEPVNNIEKYNIETYSFSLNSPTRKGYIFKGWKSGSSYISSIPTGSTGNLHLIAEWEPKKISITYQNTYGAQNNNPTTMTYEDIVVLSNLNSNRPGYEFLGWTKQQNSHKYVTEIEHPEESVVLYAEWELIKYPINYHYEVYGSHSNNPSPTYYTVTQGVSITFRPSSDCYKFNGWVDSSGNRVSYIGTGQTGEVDLYADTTPINYTISYSNTKGASNNNPTSYNYESSEILLNDLSYSGWTFKGWQDTSTGSIVYSINPYSNRNIHLSATWEKDVN